MDLVITRVENREDGIFSEIKNAKMEVLFHTLEHAYETGTQWLPKIPNGTFTCVRGPHRLHGMTQDFITFEITGVDGHVDLLFHWGNWNADSEGCILLGEGIAQSSKGQMITSSKVAFEAFMKLQEGLDQFQLTVL